MSKFEVVTGLKRVEGKQQYNATGYIPGDAVTFDASRTLMTRVFGAPSADLTLTDPQSGSLIAYAFQGDGRNVKMVFYDRNPKNRHDDPSEVLEWQLYSQSQIVTTLLLGLLAFEKDQLEAEILASLPYTPEKFAQLMGGCISGDAEADHCQADALMCDLLRRLGYDEAVDIFEDMEKWYV